ncbi:alpha-keto acid decarboxylase family protein [Francisella tularensis subsp. novicida]|uniref:Alpha-keto acid decarboxylase family protein n=3 Tax=Pseudomonadota TaxID=1224 RepID=A0A6I4RXI1_FRATU|nr:thiamine pyrophosphate-dependent enzyme [Francisella tularensis]ABK89027.1 indolepyruvate decarboxylase [Francisella tularensis subsp. novicida U112]AJI61359.1 thiamine pyrophosphate enzyme, central domain protein [Francisella tularensis subsp. novicida U112]EDX19418.1 thiamine pyrophosphate enzyme, central domain family [Francisella tularensis subsp. novicida FTE]MBK2036083.1 alpha-keto acid decarboxylase family protein [Francisella tularensis subsp. novicida]MBK2116009.1 alpha-keto acid d
MKKYITGEKLFDTSKHATNVAEYIVARLVDLGITHSFCIPGDFSFALDRALINNPKLNNVVNANELNASYAADGYARVKGAAILSTTYAVGELSALNGVMGSKAENLVVFHLVGSPGDGAVGKKRQVHHTLGDGVFGNFFDLSASAACVSAVITPENARREMNRVIAEAFKYRKPAYISVSLDSGNRPVTDITPDDIDCSYLKSDSHQLELATNLVLEHLSKAKKVVAIPAIKLDRFGITEKAIKLIEKLNIPFSIMPHDKSVISETHPNYVGFYAGLLSDTNTAEIVEGADLIINLGDALWSDFNTAGFTNNLDLNKVLNLGPLFVEDNKTYLADVYLSELLDALLEKVESINYRPNYSRMQIQDATITKEKLTLRELYTQVLKFLENTDSLVVETGSSSLNMPKLPLPEGVKYFNQTLWGSIGWATPAALGVALANPDSRTILITGEGSHQLTLNELGVMGRYKINPIILCINNDGYMIERALELDPNPSYDDIAQLNYTKLPEAFGCNDWLAIRVKTSEELAKALKKAREHQSGVYIEVITGKYDYGNALDFFNNHLKEMYG